VAGLPAAALLFVLASPGRASAQPPSPIVFAPSASGLTLSGTASASIAPADTSYFNGYDYNPMRLFRVDLAASLELSRHLAVVGDVRLQGPPGSGAWTLRTYALFARITPLAGRALDVQVGLIPPVFGAFGRRAYPTDNPLIGYPLAYQYLTSLRSNALPAGPDDLLRMQGRGWAAAYPLGRPGYGQGLPLVDAARYPIGIELRAGDRPVELSVAVTTGGLATPQLAGSRLGDQLSARMAVRPGIGLVVGLSFSRGVYLALRDLEAHGVIVPRGQDQQRAIGIDAEYSAGHWIVRAEAVASRWSVPHTPSTTLDSTLDALALDVEARYRIRPGLYAAVRADRLNFSEIGGEYYNLSAWDAPVRRIEVGGGYSLRHDVVLKVAYQWNHRETSYFPNAALLAAQLVVTLR
jgi:hypothetical protein